jgi:glycosyltransferase 2 family protein
MQKKILKFTIKLAVSLVFIYLVVIKTNWPEVLFYLKKITWWQVVLYVFFLLGGMAICARRWMILAEFKGIRLPFKDFFKYYLTGTFINNFMPSFIAGDVYKSYAIAGEEKKYSEAASSVMMDRITGLIGLMMLSLIFSLFNFKVVLANDILIIINVLIIISLCSDFIIARIKKIPVLRRWVEKTFPEKAIKFLHDVYSYSDNYKIIWQSIKLSFWFSLIGIAILNYILFWGLGVEINIWNYLSVIFLISIVSALPVSINNIGLKEWAYITFFGFFGITSGAVVAVSVISRFLQMLVSFAALPIYLKKKDDKAP